MRGIGPANNFRTNISGFLGPAAKDFLPSRKYAHEDAETKTGAGVPADEQSRLITALKRRDRSAWTSAVELHLGEVYGFVFHLVGGNRALAEDLNQEIWLEAMDGIDQCDATRGNFRNWLFGIARRRVALHFRRSAMVGQGKSLGDQAAELGDISTLPEDVLEHVEQRSAVRAAILVLPDDRREVLLGKYVEGLSVEKIATRMGRTAKAVESLLSRSRKQLRELLRGYMTPRGEAQRASKGSSNE